MTTARDVKESPDITDIHVSHLAADVYDVSPDVTDLYVHGAFLLLVQAMGYDAPRKAHFAKYLIQKNTEAQQSHDPYILENKIKKYLRMYPRRRASSPKP